MYSSVIRTGLTSGPFFLYLTDRVQNAYLEKDMTENRIVFLFKVCLLVVLAKLRKIRVMIFWYHRTAQQQLDLYEIGRSIELDRKPVTNCDGFTKKSKHQLWLAVDLVIVIANTPVWTRVDQYQTLGKLAKMIGLRWGGDWNSDEVRDPTDFDIYHFEFKGDS